MHDELSCFCAFSENGDGVGTVVAGVMFSSEVWWTADFLVSIAFGWFLSLVLEMLGVEINTANRIAFYLLVRWGLWFWMRSSRDLLFHSGDRFGLGVIMPLSSLMCDPRHPSTWL